MTNMWVVPSLLLCKTRICLACVGFFLAFVVVFFVVAIHLGVYSCFTPCAQVLGNRERIKAL